MTGDSGEDIKLRCDFRSSSKARRSKVRWFKNQAPIEVQKDKVSVRTVEKPIDDQSGRKRIVSRLILTQVNVLDTGFYKCQASDTKETVESEAVLRIQPGK